MISNESKPFKLLAGAATVVGAVVLLKGAIGAGIGVYRAFLRPAKNLRKYGQWAVVTGATAGIGRALCFELARSQRMNVLLVSRTHKKLEAVAQELRKEFPALTFETECADFSRFDDETRRTIKARLDELDVGLLINNAGVSYEHPQYLTELDDATAQNLIDVNVSACSAMTRLVLPKMVERGRGAIVNLSSGTAVIPSPFLSQYAGVKSYVEHFSRSLHHEYKDKGIDIQAQIPFLVSTKMSKVRQASLFCPSPESFAKASVASIGHGEVAVPYWSHRVQHALSDILPQSISVSILKSGMAQQRDHALKKAERRRELEARRRSRSSSPERSTEN